MLCVDFPKDTTMELKGHLGPGASNKIFFMKLERCKKKIDDKLTGDQHEHNDVECASEDKIDAYIDNLIV